MVLAPGTSLGPYQVTAKIGEGGMGEVYQARDTKLDRDVALKVLSEAFTSDPDRLARFEREAKVLASLNHPNIGSIYGLEEADGVKALVLELIEGPTLADRIARGPIPIDEAQPIATQVAEALEAAHEAGVIHRDLKPTNIKVREDGTVKVLDFGLAKALDPTPQGNPDQSPTLTAASTQLGVILGTAAYMSPEQARGKPVDKRTDIWAFGVVLYEMLTGHRAFHGENVSLTLASVMKSDVSVASVPPEVPVAVRTVLTRCLVKDAKQRLRDIGDVRLAMDGAFEATGSSPSERVAPSQLQIWQRPVWAGLIVLGAAILAGYAVWRLTPVPPRPVMRFVASTSPAASFFARNPGSNLAISPDGRRLAYLTADDGVYVRPIDRLDGTSLVTELTGASSPFFSPDGDWLGFASVSDRTWKKVSVLGGDPVTLWDVSAGPRGAAWGPDDTIVFALNERFTGLRVGPATGGVPDTLTTPDQTQGEVNHWWPERLPGGRAFLFTIVKGPNRDEYDIAVLDVDTGVYTVVVKGGTYPRYAPTGHIVYGTDGRAWAAPFDLNRLVVTGDPVPVLERVFISTDGGMHLALSSTGTLAYTVGSGTGDDRTVAFVDSSGRADPLNLPPDRYMSPRVSPDGERLAVQTMSEDGGVIWTYGLADDRQIRQLTFEGDNQRPIWTPDGTAITFASDRDGTTGLYSQPVDGSAAAERLTSAAAGERHFTGSWSPDGSVLAFQVAKPNGLVAIWTLSRVDGGWESAPLLEADGRLYGFPEFSPDGRWLAYGAGDSPITIDVYVEPFPPTGRIERISRDGGYYPFWSRNSDRLFYRNSNSPSGVRLRAVDIETTPEFRFTNETLLAPDGFVVETGFRDFDVTADGEDLVMVFPAEQEEAPPEVAVVVNWTEELLERVPLP